MDADVLAVADENDETTELRPKLLSDTDNNLYKNRERYDKEELLSRLSRALTKLKQYDQNTTATWTLDLAIPDARANCSIFTPKNVAKLPQHVEENIMGIIQSAQDYIAILDEQLKALDIADEQVKNSVVKAVHDIDETYQKLMNEVCQEINHKREILKLETEVHKNEGLIPLKACRQEVNAQIRSAQHLCALVETMLKNPQLFNREKFAQIIATSSNIGRIPEVPYVEELPYINFSRPCESSKEDVLDRLSKLGCVMRAGPVQIINIDERPASLFLSWYITDPEYAGEEHTYIVQKATGEVLDPASDVFETVYEGSETSCFIRDLPIDESITVRVRIVAPDIAWSVHRVAKTTKPCYSWKTDNKNYIITNNARIAAKLTNDLSTLFSDGPQFDANHVIEFMFLEATQTENDDEGIALVREPENETDDLKRTGCLLITCRGKIFMDGEEKSMRLPDVRFGTRMIITAMRKDSDTLRVNIESADRGVTYDWRVKTPLHFAARFREYNKWNLMVK